MKLILLLLAAGALIHARADCTFTVSPAASVPSGGGTGSVTVAASAGDCAWTASSSTNWISIASGQSGIGNGSVSFAAGFNPGSQNRSGSITVAGQSVAITQAGSACGFAIDQNSASISAVAQTGSFNLTGLITCAWTASSNAPWLQVTSGLSGNGAAAVAYSATANTSRTSRNGVIQIAGLQFTVTQAGTCTFALTPGSGFFPVGGDNGTFSVASGPGCNWTATSTVSWITISFGQSGTANGSVGFTVTPNTGPARSGAIAVGGQQFSLTQDGVPCAYSLSAASAALEVAGGTGTISVTAPSGCVWSANSTVNWISSASSGAGNGVVSYSVGQNPSPEPRAGSIRIGDQVFVISQSGFSCKYAINPSSKDFPTIGGSATFNVTATAGCNWDVVSSATWVTISFGVGGVGSGSVGIVAAPNPEPRTRKTLLTIADQVFTITQQAGACIVSLSATSAEADFPGATASFFVTADCPWTAASQASWITVASTAGGNVVYTVAANPSAAPRTGTIAAGGQTFRILQAGAPCRLTLSESIADFPSAGGSGVVRVAATVGCEWAPVSEARWVHATWSAINGSGAVTYMVEPNDSLAARSATLVVAGQTLTITQQPTAIPVTSAAVQNGASYAAGSIAPGLIVSILTPGIRVDPAVTMQLTADRRAVTTTLANARVLFDGVAAPMIYVADGRVSAVAPYGVGAVTTTRLQVEYKGERSNALTLPVAAAAPGLFTADASGVGPGAILNQNASVNSTANPAVKGSIVVLYATGEGQTIPAGVDGRLAATPLPRPALAITARIDGIDAEVLYAGAARDLVAGVIQVNVRVPLGARTGDVPVVLRVGTFESQPGVTVAVR